MRDRRDAIAVVEASYDLAADDEAWLRSLLDRIVPFIDGGLGAAAFRYEVGGAARLRWTSLVRTDVDPEHELALMTALRTTPDTLLRLLRAPGCVTSASGVLGTKALARDPDMLGPSHGLRDLVRFNACDLDGRGLVVAAAHAKLRAVSRTTAACLELCAAHVVAAMRLRARARRPELVEAIFEADGRVAHAAGRAREGSARVALREGARAMDRARGALRREAPEDALMIWRGLIDGRWSLVETIESDGRRYLVARRNEPNVRDPRALTRRERQVVAYVVRGHPVKLIGYELGLAPSTIATHLQQAMRKLGVRTRAELVRVVGGEAGRPAGPELTV